MSGNILDLIKHQRSEILKDNERLDSLLLLASINNTNVNKENKNSIVEEEEEEEQNVRIIRKKSTNKNNEENNKNKSLLKNDPSGLFLNNKILTPLSSASLDLENFNENNQQNIKEKSSNLLNNSTQQNDTTADKILTQQLLILKKAAPHLGIGEQDLINYHQKKHDLKSLIHKNSDEIPINVKEKPAAKCFPSSASSDGTNLEPILRKIKISPFCYDQRLTTEQNETILNNREKKIIMDKPKSILSNRRRERCFMDGFSYTDRHEELERERLKRDAYQRELRMQIEEKRHLVALHEEQERRERELETRRLEQQIQRMRDEDVHNQRKKSVRNELMRRHSDDLMRRKTELYELQRPLASRRYADSESANLDILGASTQSSFFHQNSPPPSSSSSLNRRPYNNNLSTSVFHPSQTTNSSYNNCSNDYLYKTSHRYYDSPPPSSSSSSSYPGGSSISSRNYSKKTLNSSCYDTVPFPKGAHHYFHHQHHPHQHQQNATKFDRFDSLSRIDALNQRMDAMNIMTRDDYSQSSDLLTDIQRRHSATQQDLSNKSPRLSRRNSLSSRFEDCTTTTLPTSPMMVKALSPVAKELRNAVPFNSSYYSTSAAAAPSSASASANPTNRWSKNNLESSSSPSSSSSLLVGGNNRGSCSILTQLSSIRTQLQREQLRMDETLRNRGLLNHHQHHLTTRTRTNNDDY